ncbi:MAG: hypothetical protein IKD93_07470 [Firmicutes bacterium]|nr:hypothetical protein [Bacillota bacterium]
MKTIDCGGLTWIEALPGDARWYWGSDWSGGDLYEAEELYEDGRPLRPNRLLLLSCPEGRVAEPIPPRQGQYFGRPLGTAEGIFLLSVDFPAGLICIDRYEPDSGRVEQIARLPRSVVPDCYNLMLHASPLCLTRQGQAGDFQLLWPERAGFRLDEREGFDFREGDLLYCYRWYEDPDYREEVVIRALPDGAVVRRLPGTIHTLPNGERWHLT